MQHKISNAEWQVMEVLWSGAPRTARALIDRVDSEKRWSPKTVRTLLARLVKKGIVEIEEASSPYRYLPSVTREACVRDAADSFLRRVFAGDRGALLLHFARSEALTTDQLRALRDVLSEDDA